MRKLLLIQTLIVFLFSLSPLYSQVDLKLIIRNPTPSEIYEWQQDPTIVQIIVNNQTSTDFPNATFGFRISNEDGIVIAESKYNTGSAPRFNIAPAPQVTILNGTQIIDVNTISYNNKIRSAGLIPNSLPEGFYEICISIYDQSGNNITSGEEYCTNFTILIPEPPVIIAPMDDEILNNPYPNFIWTPITNYSTGRSLIKYKLKICPVYKGQSARDAIDRNPVLLEKDGIMTTSYVYLPSDMPFDYYKNIQAYVWMVQAFDANGKPATSNQGRSEIATFKPEDKNTQDIILTNIYPLNEDTIPWELPHLVTQFAPYSDDVSSVNINLRVKKDGTSEEYTNTRSLNFVGGAQTSQQLNSQEEASLLISNLDNNKTFPSWMQNLEKGVKYKWTVEAIFTKTDGSTQTVTSTESSFVIGFKKPLFLYPSKDSLIKVNATFDCSFKIPEPQSLNFENDAILNNTIFHGYNSYAGALSKFSIDLAKKPAFDSIVQTQSFVIPENSQYKTGDDCKDIFTKITRKLNAVKDTGIYYFRLNYLNNNDQKYYTSETRSIKFVPDSLKTCFEMLVLGPPDNGTWTTDKKPRFSVSIKPQINKNAITGGRIRVWKKTTPSQTNENAKTKKPVLDTVFIGHEDKKIFAFSTDLAGYTKYDLNFINGDSTSKSFTAGKDSTYLWNFELNFNKDSIRTDKLLCDKGIVNSNDGTFKVSPNTDAQESCPGGCYADAISNKTPGTQTLKKDSTIKIGKFDIKLISISGTPAFLSGQGSVKVPYLRGNILVEFDGLKVNSDNKVYEGEAYAKIDLNAPYTQPGKDDYEGKALSFAHDKLKFKEIYEYSSSAGKLVSAIVGSDPVTLPLGFDKNIEGYPVVIGIVGMRFTPLKGTLNAAMYVEFPSLGPDIGFGLGATDICFHDDGFDTDGRKMLYLAEDVGYNSDDSWGFLFKATTPADSGTYAIWDCKGFRQLNIAADVEFPRTWLKPAPDPDPSLKVKAHFKARADKNGAGWHWMGYANMAQSELSGAEGYKMSVQEMTLDLSPVRNPVGIAFPKNYSGDKTIKWEGFYIKRATLSFPDDIKTFDDESPVLSLNNVIITKSGFTASIWGENVIQYPKANFGDWGASIDTIKIDFVNSSLQSGYFKGKLKVSIFDSSLVYSGLMAKSTTNNKFIYQFSIIPKDTVSADIWKLKMHLYPTSRVEVNNNSGSFNARAVLNGKITMEGNIGNIPGIDFKGLAFEGLTVQKETPRFDIGNWSLASPQHGMAGFPVSINNIDLVTRSMNGGFGAGLQFDLNVSFQSGSNAFSGATKLSVWGKLESASGPEHFVFDGIELDSIGVNADLGSVKIRGGLALYNSHATYGNGFRGAVNADFIDQLSVSATAQFGSVNNYRYWYVDAKAIFHEGIPVFTGVGMYGFGGGAWYHMRKSGTTNLSTSATPADTSLTPGKSNSGYSYVPDNSVGLGLNASLVLGTHPSPEAFNCDLGLEAQFLSGGGLGTVSLIGDGYLMCKITDRTKSKLLAEMDMDYHVPSKTFQGVVNTRIVNANPLTGNGQMEIYFAPEKWYVKLGKPSSPINIGLANLAGVQGYFMVGQDLPTPTMPAELQALFPDQQIYRNPAIGRGDGFAFGAKAGFDTGRKTYSIFYGDFSALVGFDMALLNYGAGAHCKDMTGSIGINGWYASGQMYAALAASVGLHVDLWFTEGNYEILSLNAGATLQGAGPNPTWVKGQVSGEYSILSGRVNGYCRFEFSHGDQCEIVQENPLVKIDLISDISPVSGATNVDVMTEPQVALNFELNQPFDIQEMAQGNGAPAVRTFRVKLKDFYLKKASNNDSVPGRINIAPDKFSAYYSSHDMLLGNTNYKLTASAFGEELKNGVWSPALKNNGSAIKQSVNSNFKTGAAPNNIQPQNIAYSYPIHTQKYFLQDECRKGKVQLKFGQPDLFAVNPNNRYELVARFIPFDDNLQVKEVPFTYNSASKALLFDIPNLQNSRPYYIQFVKRQIIKNEVKTTNSRGVQESVGNTARTAQNDQKEESTYSSGSGRMAVEQHKLLFARVRSNEKILYAMHFKTSKYNTIQAKLSSFNYVSTQSNISSGMFEEHIAKYEGNEHFDNYDFKPVRWYASGAIRTFGPLVGINASQRTSPWHNSFTNPKIYDNIQWMRNKGWWGSTVNFEQCFTSTTCNFVDIEHSKYNNALAMANMAGASQDPSSYYAGSSSSGGSSSGLSGSVFSPGAINGVTLSGLQSGLLGNGTPNIIISYNHGLIIPPDYIKLKIKAINILSNPFISKSGSENSKLHSILNTDYVLMQRGNYPLKFYYNYNGCTDPDASVPTINKPFVY